VKRGRAEPDLVRTRADPDRTRAEPDRNRPEPVAVKASPDPVGAPLAAEDWEKFLGASLSRRVRVVYGRSRTTPLQAHRPRQKTPEVAGGEVDWLVRLHSMFSVAPPEVRGAVVDVLRSGRRARRSRGVLESWITEMLPRHPPPPVRESTLSTRGAHHDLERIAREILEGELRADFGPERGPPRLTWGRTGARRPRRGLRLGSYDAELALVRIHPALDQAAVPDWFVRYVLFHELLHAVHPPVRSADGRWIRHGTAFREREQAYPDLGRSLAWEKRHIDALIRSARTGKPLRAARPTPSGVRRLVQRLLFLD
jgi:hypothetical protein